MKSVRGSVSPWFHTGVASVATASLAFAAPLPQSNAPADAAAYTGSGEIVPGPTNITDFNPDANATPVAVAAEPAEVNLREALESIGPEGQLWYQHVQTLANPYFEGRVNGSDGTERARDYMQWWFEKVGLSPAFPNEDSSGDWVSYRQPFEFNTGASMQVTVDRGEMSVNGTDLTPDGDFVVLGNTGDGEISAPLVFVGYGIEEGRDGYSSFEEDTDLSGRIALLLRYEPLNEEGGSQWAAEQFSRNAGVAQKIRAVRERGAKGIILVNPPNCRDGRTGLEPLNRSRRFGRDMGLPIVQLETEAADELIRAADPDGNALYAWRRLADNDEVNTANLSDDVVVSLATDVTWRNTASGMPAENVGGVLYGRGDLRDEWIVVGGHYDHNGYGWFGTDPEDGPLFPGADDNASGTAAVLVLAQTLSTYYDASDEENLRSVLFMGFDAEERGLHGSRHYSEEPTIDPNKIAVMLNLDMVGRLRANTLNVLGTATADGMQDMLKPLFENSGMRIAESPAGSGRSDDANFARLNVPAMHFFTGMHQEYTTPEDHAWTVNPTGGAKICKLVHNIAVEMATIPQAPGYREPGQTQGQDRGYARVRLGIRPGMNDDGNGILIESVSAGTSAADGGIQGGDIMLKWDEEDLVDLGVLMEQLQNHKPGDVVKIRVKRGDEEMDLDVTLKASDG